MKTKSAIPDNKNKIVMNVCFWSFLAVDILWISAVLAIGQILFSNLSK